MQVLSDVVSLVLHEGPLQHAASPLGRGGMDHTMHISHSGAFVIHLLAVCHSFPRAEHACGVRFVSSAICVQFVLRVRHRETEEIADKTGAGVTMRTSPRGHRLYYRLVYSRFSRRLVNRPQICPGVSSISKAQQYYEPLL